MKTSTLKWISIVDNYKRTSSLEVSGNKIIVVGGLPHGSEIQPKSKEDADNLIEWLENWKKSATESE